MIVISLLMLRAGLATSLTLTAPAQSAERLLDKLSSISGVRLTCAPQTKDEILFVRVRDVTLEDLMARLASATDARWVKTDVGFRLERPIEIVRAEEAKALQQRERNLRVAIELKKKQAAEVF